MVTAYIVLAVGVRSLDYESASQALDAVPADLGTCAQTLCHASSGTMTHFGIVTLSKKGLVQSAGHARLSQSSACYGGCLVRRAHRYKHSCSHREILISHAVITTAIDT
jgi:hypothetical protein